MAGRKISTNNEAYTAALERAENWMKAIKTKGPCDKKRIEELLLERAKYLGIKKNRKIVWCKNPKDLKEKLLAESLGDLLYDCDHYWSPFVNAVYKNARSQFADLIRRQSSGQSPANFFKALREQILMKFGNYSRELPEKYYYELKDAIWILNTRERKGLGSFKKLWEFWKDFLHWREPMYYDCVLHSLPDASGVKNYLAYLGEAFEAGLILHIPTKNIDFLVPSPNRQFEEAISNASSFISAIDWGDKIEKKEEKPKENPKEKEIPKTISQKDETLETILKNLSALQVRLSENEIKGEVFEKIMDVSAKISLVLPRLKKDHPSNGLTFDVQRIAEKYLIELLDSYISLSERYRRERMPDILKVLNILADYLDEAQDQIDLNQVTRFEIIAEGLRQLFGKSSLDV